MSTQQPACSLDGVVLLDELAKVALPGLSHEDRTVLGPPGALRTLLGVPVERLIDQGHRPAEERDEDELQQDLVGLGSDGLGDGLRPGDEQDREGQADEQERGDGGGEPASAVRTVSVYRAILANGNTLASR
ncbi:hypothetical protein [Actinoplanes sp. NPDC049802]|uniref:hypothetical protein n=1 Tax=Actinoplanes sp. NPDC049802 TaxID=3154742 RepID=UPI003411E2CE